MNKNMPLLALALVLCGAGAARADLSLIDPPAQTNTPYDLTFIATGTTLTVSFAGYQVPSFEDATNISLTGPGGPANLLGPTWAFVPAAAGSDTFTFSDGTAIPALSFGGVVTGSYDTYSQSIASVAGQTYTLDFLFSNPANNAPSGFMVTSSGIAVTPEPSAMIPLTAMLGLAFVARRRLSQPRS